MERLFFFMGVPSLQKDDCMPFTKLNIVRSNGNTEEFDPVETVLNGLVICRITDQSRHRRHSELKKNHPIIVRFM